MPLPSLRPETVTYAGEGFRELRQQPFSTCENQQHGHRIELNIDWEVHQAMCRYPNSNNFSQICTINGGEIDAQAAACEDYIQEHFAVGKDILYAIQSAWGLGASYEANPIEGDYPPSVCDTLWTRKGEGGCQSSWFISCPHGSSTSMFMVLLCYKADSIQKNESFHL